MRPISDRPQLPRVLFVSAVPGFKGGAEVVLRAMLANPHAEPVLAVPEEGELAAAARAMGVVVCTYDPGAMMHVHRPPRVGPMLAAGADAVRCAWRLRRLAAEHRCAILHSNGLKPHMLAALLGDSATLRTLVHLHDIPYRRSERLIWRAIARRVGRVVLVSRPCFPAARLPRHVEVVANGIDTAGWPPPQPRASGTLRLGFVGRFHPNKGLDLLLDWFAALRRAGPGDATLTIRGRPDPDQPAYWQAIQARISAEGLADAVLQEGWVEGADTYRDLDVLLVTSRTPDPAPLVVLEAMRAGLVVAGYPAGGVPTMIEDGVTGLLVRTGAELSERLGGLLAEPERFEAMRRAAHQAVVERFGVDGFHDRLGAIYRSMVAAQEPGPTSAAAGNA